ncbi:MAG: HAMP domain-containing protein [Oscillatoriales cyanobacterium]|nr:MAG: HAMP domain-containing protein [Oscillatoriales cyanobacterium]
MADRHISSLASRHPNLREALRQFAHWNLKLRTALVVPLLLQIMGTVALVGWLSFRSGERSVSNLAMRLHVEVAERTRERIRTYIEVPQLVNRVNVNAIKLGLLDFSQIGAAQNYFWQQVQTYPAIGYVGFANTDAQSLRVGWVNRLDVNEQPQVAEQLTPGGGNLEFYNLDTNGTRSARVRTVSNYDVRQRPFYQVGDVAKRPTWSEVYSNYSYPKLLQMNATSPYYDESGQFQGILTCQIGLNQIGEFLQTLRSLRSGQIYILERNGYLVASSMRDQPLIQSGRGSYVRLKASEERYDPLLRSSANFLLDRFQDLHHITEPLQINFEADGQSNFLYVSPFQDDYGLDWLIVIVVPKADFMAEIHTNTRNTALLCLAALILAMLSCWIFSRWITDPVLRVVHASEAMASGQLEQSIPPSRLIEVNSLANSFTWMSTALKRSFDELEERVEQRTAELNREKERSDMLLRNVLPATIVDRLTQEQDHDKDKYFAEYFEEATVLFADLVGFTPLAAQLEAIELVSLLDRIFSEFDHFTDEYGLEKIKTIGDAYMVASGIPAPNANRMEAIADMALAMQTYMQGLGAIHGHDLQVRIGINSGPAIAGVIGTKKFIYDIWGDAVNLASRLESHGIPGRIQVSQGVYNQLKVNYRLEKRGNIEVKGRGVTTTYWLLGKRDV